MEQILRYELTLTLGYGNGTGMDKLQNAIEHLKMFVQTVYFFGNSFHRDNGISGIDFHELSSVSADFF